MLHFSGTQCIVLMVPMSVKPYKFALPSCCFTDTRKLYSPAEEVCSSALCPRQVSWKSVLKFQTGDTHRHAERGDGGIPINYQNPFLSEKKLG